MVINVNDYLLSQGHLIPGFSGIGNFKGRRANEYSQDESTILEHFFTNIDSNVYAAKDTMPSQLWALVMGQYARSPVTLKERLLSILREVPKKDPSAPSLEELASSIRNNGDINDRLLRHLDKASAFIVEFGIDYGHASLRDSGVIRMCFEGVSQRATKFLEEAREGAYQEQSTRALSFTDGLAMPFEVRGTRFQRRFAELGEKLIKFYSKVYDTSESWLKKEYADLREDADKKIRDSTGNQEAKLSDPAWNRVIGEKAFDIARFLLPQFATTSLGMTLNTRRFQDILTAWQSSEFDEIRLLGKAAQVEAAKLFPYLLVYGDTSDFHSHLPERVRNVSGLLPENVPQNYGNRKVRSNLIAYTPEIEDFVLASIIFGRNPRGRDILQLKDEVRKLPFSERRKIAKTIFEGKKTFEVNPKATEIGSLTFARSYDIGSYRDLQRQRGDRQQASPYSTDFGYHAPEEIEKIGLTEEFDRLMVEVKKLHDDLKTENMHSAAEYVPVMASMMQQVVTMDPNQLFYQAQLRCQPAGADSYRSIALQEIEQGLELLPSFRGLIHYDSTKKYPLNRLPEAIEKRIRSRKK